MKALRRFIRENIKFDWNPKRFVTMGALNDVEPRGHIEIQLDDDVLTRLNTANEMSNINDDDKTEFED
jgi:hypothetical protein